MKHQEFRAGAPNARQSRWSRRSVPVGTAALLFFAACGGHSGSTTRSGSAGAPNKIGNATSPHAIHLFAKAADGTRTQLNFAPATTARFGNDAGSRYSSAIAEGGGSRSARGSRDPHGLRAEVAGDDGGTELQGPTTVEEPEESPWDTAWTIAYRAAMQCGGPVKGSPQMDVLPWSTLDGSPPWYFYGGAQSCSDRLAIEQNLVCLADHLSEVSDAVGIVVWPTLSPELEDAGALVYAGADAGGAAGAMFYNEWDIPPQQDSDRFILRDLAIHTLAMIPAVDAFMTDISFPSPMPNPMTCAQAFAWASNTSQYSSSFSCGTPSSTAASLALFGVVDQTTSASGTVTPSFPLIPPSSSPICAGGLSAVPSIAKSALTIEAQILRSAGRDLHDLIRRDVYSDLASAAQQSAEAMDPLSGSEAAWGVTAMRGEPPYGSIAHAARVLAGRWELGSSSDTASPFPPGVRDRACGGLGEDWLLPSVNGPGAYGPDIDARYTDLPISTPGQATAAQLVEQTGLVLPASALPPEDGGVATTPASSLGQVLIAQLQLQAGQSNGVVLKATDPQAVAIADEVNALAADDVTFAFWRALRTWRMLTNSAAGVAPIGGVAGVNAMPATAVADAGAALGAIVVAQPSPLGLKAAAPAAGMSRSRLKTDTLARAGGLLQNSQCADAVETGGGAAPTFYSSGSGWTAWGLDSAASMNTDGANATLPTVVFQDSFHIGQALERRLSLIDQLALQPGAAATAADAVARGGIAELRSWAGSTMFHILPNPGSSGTTPTSVSVLVEGLLPSDLGASAGATMTSVVQNAYGFVYGPPWAAECAVGVRPDCPTGFVSQYVQRATAVVDLSQGGPSTLSLSTLNGYGVLSNTGAYLLNVPLPLAVGSPNGGTMPVLSQGATPDPNNRLYVVLLSDPTKTNGVGRVLGPLPVELGGQVRTPGTTCGKVCPETQTYGVYNLVDAPMQRELLHDALDIGAWVGAAPPALGDPSASHSSGYCVDGVPRNVFVPLDNELIAGTQTYEDSWQAYLSLAQQAATTADTLGKELIQNDLLISQSEQSAAEQLANICGDFGSLSTAAVGTNGTITAGPEDSTTQTCISEPITDVVFLGQMPQGLQNLGSVDQTTCAVKQAIGCANPTSGNGNASCAASTVFPVSTATPPSASVLCAKPELSVAALGIVDSYDAGAPTSGPLSTNCGTLVNTIVPSLKTGFLGTQFLGVLNSPEFSTDAMLGVVSSLQMSVDQADHWQVLYGATPIMDSTNGAYWPACNNTSCALAPVLPQMQVLAAAWNAAFRECSGAACNSPVSAGEMNMIKWRVTQALWMIGASAGQLPQGAFSLPVPATFVPTSTVQACGQPCFSAYGYAPVYIGTATSAGLGLDPSTTAADITATQGMLTIAAPFATSDNSTSAEVPTWYRSVYSATVPFYHLLTANDALTFPHCQLAAAGCDPSGTTPPKPFPVALSSLVSNAASLNNFQCANAYGEPTAGTTPTVSVALTLEGSPVTQIPWWEYVAMAKQLETDTVGPEVNAGPLLSSGTVVSVSWDNSVTGDISFADPSNGKFTVPFTWDPSSEPRFYDGEIFWMPAWGPPACPSCVSPAARVPAFVGAGTRPNGTCGAANLLVQAALLACTPAPAMASQVNLSQPPVLQTPADIAVLEAWLGSASGQVASAVASLYAQEIPTRVVTDFQRQTVGSGDLGGTKGQALLDMEQHIESFPESWTEIASDLSQVQSAIQTARYAIAGADLADQTAMGGLALERLKIEASSAQAVVGFLETVTNAAAGSLTSAGVSNLVDPIAAIGLAQTLNFNSQETAVVDNQIVLANRTEQNSVAAALAALAQTDEPLWADIQKTVDALRGDIAQIDLDGQNVQQAQQKAAYELAVGTGQDFVEISGQEVPIPVDTVLRRQSSATAQRYQVALTNAKALAYMARRAIEQRIGVTLDSVTQNVGPLDAPASWADDICSLQGVNYASLSVAVPSGQDGGGIGGAQDQQAISQFANAWVGDYVTKLQNFVTYYNVQYPSHQGDDTAVLSLRYDLLGPVPQCSAPAPNVLVNSGDLSRTSATGWNVTPCAGGSNKCLVVTSGPTLRAPLDGPWGAEGVFDASATNSGIGVTWLSDLPVTPAPDGGVDGSSQRNDGGATSPAATRPNNLVVQQIQSLTPGSYVLSWWEQARDSQGNVILSNGALVDGGVPSSTPVPYVAEVFDANWNVVSSYSQLPFEPAPTGGTTLWSPRRTLTFTVTTRGTYTVAFGASLLGGALGSVAIADVQLELGSQGPTDYVATSDTTNVVAYNCPRSDSDLRSAFTHSCNSNGVCSYDLNAPLVVDTATVNSEQSALDGKVAAGNYNYRHIDLAVNLVGTGVHTCANDSNPNCYSAGYIEYDLSHDATSAGIIGYDGNDRVFDFGTASVNHGKALAAERYLTMPLSSADQQLVTQPGIQHIELGGRPIDGQYHLRIWDSPDLDWSQLQDIQIIFDYQYWTNIIANGNVAQVQPHKLKRAPIRPIIAPQRHRKSLARR